MNDKARSAGGHYYLDPEIGEGRVPMPCDDVIEWATRFENSLESRQVGSDIVGTILLSTVFLGLDHQFGDGPPMLFETMAFDESDKQTVTMGDQSFHFTADIPHIFDRYSTWEEAELGHRDWLYKLKRSIDTGEE